jgi:hypothetical protein
MKTYKWADNFIKVNYCNFYTHFKCNYICNIKITLNAFAVNGIERIEQIDG